MKRLTALLLALITVSAFLLPALAANIAPDALEYTEADVSLLARLITAEAENQPYEGQLAVGNVVLNRVASGIKYFGRGLRGVIYRKNQFTAPKKYYTESAYLAAVAALNGERAVPEYVHYFQRADKAYFYGRRWGRIGAHTFYGNQSKESSYD